MPVMIGLSDAAFTALASLLIFGTMLSVALVFLAREGRLTALLGINPGINLALGFSIGVGALALAAALASLAIELTPGGSPTSSALLLGIVVVAFQASVEEVYFRGWLQPRLVAAWGPVAGVLVVAIVFSLLHVSGGVRSPLALLNILLAGSFFGLLALRSGGTALPAGAHFGWNTTEQLGLGLDPNPGTGSFTSLFDLDMSGSALWGGSAEGLNASLAVTIVLLAMLVPTAASALLSVRSRPSIPRG
jgi:hypothetical protein